jgi:hypothetical protein
MVSTHRLVGFPPQRVNCWERVRFIDSSSSVEPITTHGVLLSISPTPRCIQSTVFTLFHGEVRLVRLGKTGQRY